MGGGGQQTEPVSGKGTGFFTWEEVQKHSNRNDQWLVVKRKVYNVTNWAKRHPGGFRVISHYAGEDATEVFAAFHPDQDFVQKFLKPLHIGELAATEPSQDREKNDSIIKDFDSLRVQTEKEALAWLSVCYWGTSWTMTFLCATLLATAQAQAGWLQHDFGHLSVFRKSKWNHLVHKFVIGHLKGASANWWNHRHFQHHAKPNIFRKDPDINVMDVFVLGNTQPVEYGIKKIKKMPYNRQHEYFFLLGPPLLIPVFYNFNIFYTMITRRDWVDLSWAMTYYFRYYFCFVPLYGFWGSFALQLFARFLESHWFVWVTQMNHLPMEMEHEKRQDWMTTQLLSTCNVEQSFFNDWFSGHLNFQIEHHLFPRMPRHNYHLVAPQVRALCEKHGIPYEMKSLWRGMVDVVRSLKKSGDLWLDAYLHK
uniref:acyl-CoA (8-3)-desaturase n=1 Tax=Oryzias sinensis TaxID=183150 RepID=A0A0F7G9T9_9TELE|nr:fatty acid desaturase 2 [Oryzias sinensis]